MNTFRYRSGTIRFSLAPMYEPIMANGNVINTELRCILPLRTNLYDATPDPIQAEHWFVPVM